MRTGSEAGAAGDVAARQAWMAVLAKADSAALEAAWARLPARPSYSSLRPSEVGLVMVRGRAGGVGQAFNLGEMTVTRAAVRLENGPAGVAYVAGRGRRHAELAAVVDAMMQSDVHRDDAARIVVAPLAAALDAQRDQRAREAAATKVEFFTMVRTRGPK